MSIFVESIDVVRKTEAQLLSVADSMSYFKQLIWLPAKFILMGVSEKTKGFFIWALLSSPLVIITPWFIDHFGMEESEAILSVMLIAVTILMFLVTFSMPSTYGDSGVTQCTLIFIAQHLQERGFVSTNNIELLKKSIKLFEDRARSRVNALKWLVGVLWAVFIYIYSKALEQSLTGSAGPINDPLMPACLFLGVIVSYLCVWGYEAALDKLFRSIEFACNDLCQQIEANHKPVLS